MAENALEDEMVQLLLSDPKTLVAVMGAMTEQGGRRTPSLRASSAC